MARSSETMSIYEANNMLEERLTCPGCSNIMVEPRVLSCMHNFCYNCIEGIETEENDEGSPIISCPSCETTTDYPEGGAAALPPAFHLIAMLELYKMVHKVQRGDKNSCENCKENCAVGYCKHCSQLLCRSCITIHRRWSKFENHNILGIEQIANTALQGMPLKEPGEMPCPEHDESMQFYCNTCEHIICQTCTLNDHKEHDFKLVSDDYPEHEEEVRRSLEPLKEQIAKLEEAISDVSVRENEIMQLGEEVMGHVQQSSRDIQHTVKEAEGGFYAGVQTLVQEKLEILSQQKGELEAVLGDLKRCESHVEEELRVASPQQILTNKAQMIDTVDKVRNKSVANDFAPKVSANISMTPTDELFEKCHEIEKVDSAEIAGVQILGGKAFAVGVVNKVVCFDIRIKTNPLGYLIIPNSITCSFACAADGEERIECELEEMAFAKYRVRYTPPDTETRQLKVDINEELHFHVPFTVSIARVPELKGRLNSGITKPWGVCISNKTGQIIATDYEADQVKLFNTKGKHINTIGGRGKGKGQFKSPAGIAVNQQNQIIVVESANHRVQVISERGDFINFVGQKGTDPLQFSFPYDVAVSRSGLIFVSDCYNHRIQVLNPDLSFAGMFGSEGSANGQFKNPIGVAIDHADKVYVVDSGNERVQVFSLAGDFEREFGNNELTIPSGVVVDSNDIVYVTDTGIGQVAMFDQSGDFLGHYVSKSDEMNKPTGITIGNGNVVYVCDWGVNDILTLY